MSQLSVGSRVKWSQFFESRYRKLKARLQSRSPEVLVFVSVKWLYTLFTWLTTTRTRYHIPSDNIWDTKRNKKFFIRFWRTESIGDNCYGIQWQWMRGQSGGKQLPKQLSNYYSNNKHFSQSIRSFVCDSGLWLSPDYLFGWTVDERPNSARNLIQW